MKDHLRDSKLDSLSTNNHDMKGRRTINASPSVDPTDYVIQDELGSFATKEELATAIASIKIKTSSPTIVNKLAPNIISATLNTVTYKLWGDLTVPVFSGNMILPVAIGTLSIIAIYYTHPITKHKILIARYDNGFVGGATFAYEGYNPEIYLTGTEVTGGKLEFICYTVNFEPTPNPFTLTNVSYGHLAINALTLTEAFASRWVMRPQRSVRVVMNTQVSLGFYPGTVTIISYDGLIYQFVGVYNITEFSTLALGLEGGKEIFYAPLVDTTYTFYAVIGAWEGDDLNGWRRTDVKDGPYNLATGIPNLVASNTASVLKMQKPASTDITTIVHDAGAGGSYPYDRVIGPDDLRDWSIKQFSIDTTAAELDPNVFVYTVVVTDVNAVGADIGVPHVWTSQVPAGGVEELGHLDGPYGSVATPVRSGNIGGVKFEIYCQSRLDQTPTGWSNAAASTKQSNIDGAGHDYLIIYLTAGVTPGSLIKGHPLLGAGLQYDGGNLIVPQYSTTGPLYTDIAGGIGVHISNDYVITTVGGNKTLSQNLVNLALATNFDLVNFHIVGGSLLINAIAIDSLIAGNALFAGTATFAYKNGATEGGKVTINSLGMTFADKITSPNSTMTIAAGGLTLTNGTSSVTITPSNVTITNGVFTSPVITIVQAIAGPGTITAEMSAVADGGSHPGITVANSVSGANVGLTQNGFAAFLGASLGVLIPGALSLNDGSSNVMDITPSTFRMSLMRTTDPGAASKEVWADPADSYRLKWRI